MDYIRNGLVELSTVIGADLTKELGGKAARLIGLQYLTETREIVDVEDGNLFSGATYLARMFAGLGDTADVTTSADEITLVQKGLRIVRDLDGDEREIVLDVWIELWRGALSSFREMKTVDVEVGDDAITWKIQKT